MHVLARLLWTIGCGDRGAVVVEVEGFIHRPQDGIGCQATLLNEVGGVVEASVHVPHCLFVLDLTLQLFRHVQIPTIGVRYFWAEVDWLHKKRA